MNSSEIAASVGPNADQDSLNFGNKIYPFMCPCGKGLEREREIQAHSNCPQFTQKFCNLLQAFVTLKHDACSNGGNLRSYQAKMSLYTLLTSFRADIKEHLTREQEQLMREMGNNPGALGGGMPNHQPAQPIMPKRPQPMMNPIAGHGGAAALNDVEEMKEPELMH